MHLYISADSFSDELLNDVVIITTSFNLLTEGTQIYSN
jgi:hypothetical protein